MPKVGNRHFPYTAKGKAAAKAAAKKKGTKVGYALGGLTKSRTSAKGKKDLVAADEKKQKGKGKGKPVTLIIGMNKGGKVKKRK